jgi:glycosyltransferase involved in cell wall biosynthesis
MARQIKHKGTHKIIKAIAHENFDWYLLVGGPLVDEKYYKYLLSLVHKYNISDRVIFLGLLDEYKKSCLFKVSEYFILLSDSENFGMVILESLMHSTPVITTTSTPWKKLLEYNAGWWIEDNKKSISNALREANQITPKPYNILKKNSFLLYETFSQEKVLQKYTNMYNFVYTSFKKNIRK